MDGVTYLLKGLPRDLDACEMKQIQSALPPDLRSQETLQDHPESDRIMSITSQRSFLHRGVQMAVVNFIFFVHLLIPYFMFLLKQVAQVERRYKVSETLVSHGKEVMNVLGKQSISLTEAISHMNDGKVGQSILDVVSWTIAGVTQGIYDGVGEGLMVVGATEST